MFLTARDRAQQREAANARIGHRRAYWILYGRPMASVLVPVGAVAGGGAWLWTTVSRTQVSTGVGLIGVGLATVYGVWWIKTSSPQARIRARAMGVHRSIRMHLVGAAGLLLVAAAIALYGAA